MKHQPGWQFKPPLWAWCLTPVVIAALASLSVWQLGRAAEKRERIALYEQGGERVAVPDGSTLDQLRRFTPVRLEGRYLSERQFLLDNQHRDSRLGFHVWTPFRLADDDTVVIVDRGWLPRGEADQVNGPEGVETVRGRLDRLPRPGLRLDTPTPSGEWPRKVYFPEQGVLAEQLDAPVHDGRVLLDAAEPAGFRRDWQPVNLSPERHVGYAFQWAALAVAVLVIFIVVNLKRVPTNEY